MDKLLNILKALANKNIEATITFDIHKKMFCLNLNTMAKSNLTLFEDQIIIGRYDYQKKMDLDKDIDEILHDLCYEFVWSLHHRNQGNGAWFDLCDEYNVGMVLTI